MKKILLTLSAFLFVAPAFATTNVDVPIQGTTPESKITGVAHLHDEGGSLVAEIHIENAPPGLHGIHFHENGSCDDTGNAAGGHFNPDKVSHGHLPKDGHNNAHAGDMGNIEIGEDGKGHLKVTLPNVTLLNGKYAVNNRSIILHEKPDDFGQPTGNAGGRIGCGIVRVMNVQDSDGAQPTNVKY